MSNENLPELDTVYQGDNLDIMKLWPSEFVDLIYIDPPFNTGIRRTLNSIKLNTGATSRTGFNGKKYSFEIRSSYTYSDDMPLEDYLDFLYVRLNEAKRLLKPEGSLYLHLDYRVIHYARLIMDEIFGADKFINEIIWAYDFGGRSKDRWPKKHDNILWYAKGETWTFQRDEIERIPYMAPGLVGPEKAARGKLPTDTWWITIVPTHSRERSGYPTQKPEKLLERIISASSKPNDIVLDFFAGSGTTGIVAQKLRRKWLLIDRNPEAIRIIRERLLAWCQA